MGLGIIRGLAVGPDNTVYFLNAAHRVRAITPDGFIRAVAGDGSGAIAATEQAFATTDFTNTEERDIRVAADGAVIVADGTNRIRRIAAPFPGLSMSDVLVPSSDASEVYVFSGNGRHLKTLDPLTGVALATFRYDSSGRLTGVFDSDSLLTAIGHDTDGRPTAVVAPFGQRTEITADSDGFIATVTAPATTPYVLTYGPSSTALGMLATYRDPATGLHSFAYDSLGRLVSDANESGAQTLVRTDSIGRYTITHTDAAGVATRYEVIGLASGASRNVTLPAGSRPDSATFQPTGASSRVASDGTRTATAERGDPRFGAAAPFLSQVTVDGETSPNTTSSIRLTAVRISRGCWTASPFSSEPRISRSAGRRSSELIDTFYYPGKVSVMETVSSELASKRKRTPDRSTHREVLRSVVNYGHGRQLSEPAPYMSVPTDIPWPLPSDRRDERDSHLIATPTAKKTETTSSTPTNGFMMDSTVSFLEDTRSSGDLQVPYDTEHFAPNSAL